MKGGEPMDVFDEGEVNVAGNDAQPEWMIVDEDEVDGGDAMEDIIVDEDEVDGGHAMIFRDSVRSAVERSNGIETNSRLQQRFNAVKSKDDAAWGPAMDEDGAFGDRPSGNWAEYISFA
ncbi:uncharacterized protein F5147DRAFT_658723 [Suillus discolor]|uniref:Uncharacterized protein n=1 Tax=Suillus discolor TaxID=1912936 RepID=A0A9P7JM88_9AGAM|nr:uncharacterized protein F5147DRAFT_658723 [Suillus discolor]KAG2088385.1 hypothetical protein F5147DRAFT_658723 [Suillus discolor]